MPGSHWIGCYGYDKLMRQNIDLHIHSNQSDGSFTPEKIVAIAAAEGLSAISITDHDNNVAFQLAQPSAAHHGIENIPGIELSSEYNGYTFHLLGYYLDSQNSNLLSYLVFLKEERLRRARKILSVLERLGILIGLEEVLDKTSNGSIARPHIADLMIEKGFVDNRWEAFNRYLGDNAVAFVAKKQIGVRETLELIHQANGICVVAHPPFERLERYISTWIDYGLDGIEVIHPRFSYYHTQCLSYLAERFQLIKTGGSDCHGFHDVEPRIGKIRVPVDFLIPLRAAHAAVVSKQLLQQQTG
jgi:predicted metal-dependent phosphoesterase TrpH